MVDQEFLGPVRELGVHERAVRAPSQLKSERTRVFTSLERLLAFLEELPTDAKLEEARKKDRYVLYISR